MADYIHLNPARAGLAGGGRGTLADYAWSSVAAYSSGKPPAWLETGRVLRAFELARDGRGRRAYVAWLEARAANPEAAIDAAAAATLKRGWYLGEETFKDRLLALVDRARGVRQRVSRHEEVSRDYGERGAERLIGAVAGRLGLPTAVEELAALRKGDHRKALLAAFLRKHTGVGTSWIAGRLGMGHSGSVSRLIGLIRNDPEKSKALEDLGEM